MSFPSEAHAFAAGLQPALVGAYFRIADLLAAHGRSPVEPLREYVAEEVQRLRRTGRDVVEVVEEVRAASRLVGLEPAEPPRVPNDYGDWWAETYEAFVATGGDDARHASTHAAGHALGMALVALNVATVVLRMRVADPESPSLDQALQELREELRFVRGRCDVAADEGVSNEVRTALVFGRDVVDDVLAMALYEDEPADWARAGAAVQERLRALDGAVRTLRDTLEERGVADA